MSCVLQIGRKSLPYWGCRSALCTDFMDTVLKPYAICRNRRKYRYHKVCCTTAFMIYLSICALCIFTHSKTFLNKSLLDYNDPTGFFYFVTANINKLFPKWRKMVQLAQNGTVGTNKYPRFLNRVYAGDVDKSFISTPIPTRRRSDLPPLASRYTQRR